MKKAGFSLDLKSEILNAFGKRVKLETTTSGHYIVALIATKSTVEASITQNERFSRGQLKKLHEQFGHCSASALEALLKNTGYPISRSDVESMINGCEICRKTAKNVSKSIVGLPHAVRFNQCVAMDHHQIDSKLWYLHFICLFSKFSVATIIEDKRAGTIIFKFLRHWIAVLGPPDEANLSDNGGVFNNDVIRDLGQNLNLNTKPLQLIRHSVMTYVKDIMPHLHIFQKTRLQYHNLDLESCIACSCFAKNSLYNNHDFTPSQIAIGQNPCLPSVLDNKLPALEGTSISKFIADHLSSIQSTRIKFRADSCEKLRRDLKHNVRISALPIACRDKVYYRRAIDKKWCGPACVIGIDRSIAFVRHGGQVLGIHCTDLQHAEAVYNKRKKIRKSSSTKMINVETRMILENLQDVLRVFRTKLVIMGCFLMKKH